MEQGPRFSFFDPSPLFWAVCFCIFTVLEAHKLCIQNLAEFAQIDAEDLFVSLYEAFFLLMILMQEVDALKVAAPVVRGQLLHREKKYNNKFQRLVWS